MTGGESTDDMAGLQKFGHKLKVTYPAGLEISANYVPFTKAFQGLNPFPVDIVVGKDGKIAYVAREYDPAGIAAAIKAELAK